MRIRLKPYNLLVTISIVLSSVFSVFGNSTGESILDKSAASHFFSFHGDSDYHLTNGYDFFERGDRIYIIVWQEIGNIFNYAYDSQLVSINKESKDWTIVSIPGKAYYLGPYSDHEICSIRRKTGETKWYIGFYNLKGEKLRELEHIYETFDKEFYHFVPVPLIYPDGSILFYSTYGYEGRNIVLKSLLDIISGGHGSKKMIGENIEIIPSLIRKEGKERVLSYVVGYDSSNLRTIFSVGEELSWRRNRPKSGTFNKDGYKINKYDWIHKEGVLFVKNNKKVKISDNIEIIDSITGEQNILPLPNLGKAYLKNGKFKYDGEYVHDADIWVDSDSIILAVTGSKKIWIYFYNLSDKRWIRNILDKNNVDFYGYKNVRIFRTQNHLFIGFWANLKNYEIIKISLNALKEDGTIHIIDE